MVTELQSYNKPEYIHHVSYHARELPTPRFARPVEVRGSSRLVRAIAWSCDGKVVATGTENKGIRLWPASTPFDVASSFTLPSSSKPTPHNGHVASLQFSPNDPNVLISGCKASPAGGVIAIWDITSPNSPTQTFSIRGDVLHIAFHPSGRHFAVVCPRQSRDEVFFFWKVLQDGKYVWEMRDDIGMGGPHIDIGSEEINSLCFLKNGKAVCAVSNDGSLNAWSYPSERRAYSPLDPGPGQLSGPSTSPPSPKSDHDDGALASAKSRAPSPAARSRDGDGEEHDENAVTEDHPTEDIAEEASGALELGEQNVEDGAEAQEAGAEAQEAGAEAQEAGAEAQEAGAEAQEAGAEVQEAEPAATEGNSHIDKTVEETQVEDGNGADVEMAEVPTSVAAEGAEIRIIIPDDRRRQTDGSVDVEMGETSQETPQAARIEESANPTLTPSHHPSPPPSAKVPAVDPEAEAEKLRARQLTRVRHSIVHSASLLALALDPLGRYLAVGGQDAMLSIMTMRDWICVRTIDVCTAAIRMCAFSPDGELIAMGGDDNAIYIASVFTGQTVARVPVHGTVNALAWHPLKSWLAYSTSAKTASPTWYVVQSE
ncbi:WD40-repeat-containing domain protein [Naematelia encephala]|uniref:WD40-repeat-containing domain protein n=1 Tax=Naematelia encephala TaxID=71784 RepID=A0A1Y2AXD0_9TREE|nr:WD40-repeat-containing domain protein [Naematelia encephala]